MLDAVEAPSAEAVKALACIMETRKQVGEYDNGSPAYRPAWIVLLVQWPDGNLFGREYFTGEEPPEKIPESQSAGIGDGPTKEFSKWLLSVTDDEKILHPGAVESVVFSPDGKILAVGGGGGAVHLWDLAKEEEAGPLLRNNKMVYGIAYSPDGQTIASEGHKEIRFWEVATGTEISPIKGTETGRFVAYSPDGKMLATGGKKIIRLMDVETGEEIKILTAGGYVSRVVFSPDGKFLAAKLDETVEIWEVGTGTLKRTLGIKKQKVNDVDISPDGKTVALAACRRERIFQTSKVFRSDFAKKPAK